MENGQRLREPSFVKERAYNKPFNHIKLMYHEIDDRNSTACLIYREKALRKTSLKFHDFGFERLILVWDMLHDP